VTQVAATTKTQIRRIAATNQDRERRSAMSTHISTTLLPTRRREDVKTEERSAQNNTKTTINLLPTHTT
jgi:hypothetical protein